MRGGCVWFLVWCGVFFYVLGFGCCIDDEDC